MSLEAQLVVDFLGSQDRLIYGNKGIEDISTAGDLVLFQERSACGNYVEQHRVPLLEVMAWAYSEQQRGKN